MAEDNTPKDDTNISFFQKIGKGFKKSDQQGKYVAVYVGIGFIVAFLFMASLAPQVGEKLGSLSVKKQSQESQAGYVLKTGTIIFTASPTTVNAGEQTVLKWNAPQRDGYTRCTASGASDWTGTKEITGSQLATPTGTRTVYTLACNKKGAVDVAVIEVKASTTQGGGSNVPAGAKNPPCFVAGQTGAAGYGDSDGNGYVDKADADLILKAVAGLSDGPEVIRKGAQRFENADVNNDDQLTAVDALLIQRFLGGFIATFEKVCTPR